MDLLECLPHLHPVGISCDPRPVVLPILEALSLRSLILRVLPGETTVILSNGSPLLEGLYVRDEVWVSFGGSSHQLTSPLLLP